jgi:hypothetical protein
MSRAIALPVALSLSLCACVVVPVRGAAEPPGLEAWSHHHPEASRELGEWVRAFPQAAHEIFEWDGHHPVRSQELVRWAVEHPGAPVHVFIESHPGWPELDVIVGTHRPAANALLDWSRRHPRAALDLMAHSGGLDWAGRHLYAESFALEHPHR